MSILLLFSTISRQLPQKQHANNQKLSHLKKTNSIFVEDESYGKQEHDYQNEINNKKHLPTIVTQQQQPQQQPIKSSFQMISMDRSGNSQQASLDIPTRDDEDNKSQHSSRTMSSSRRQSTEDSIDTDDEYFCYELRKLEEMERLSQLESSKLSSSTTDDIQQSLLSKIDALNTGTDIWYGKKKKNMYKFIVGELFWAVGEIAEACKNFVSPVFIFNGVEHRVHTMFK